ncbi:cation:proton antiporter [Mycolicibacterium mengxianglii]|uniref:cation:proton antiporter n=1 Tax=Mycolicibacterium mengxianglii TaxID=2736649 RepID=UPI0018EEF6C3|nr:sodium:proton antiporter [Mycolicibacterium mengxianglii]
MELILVVVGAIAVTAIAHRRGLEPALIIVVIGAVVSFLPGFEAPELDSHILLTVVLPPLLYSAALDFSFPTFLRNIKPILGLGVALVVVTAFTVAAMSAWLVVVPLTFATALILGAIVAPPDAVTAVAVGRKLGLPKRVMAILTGESLINDAAALALFSIAVAHVAGSHTFIQNPLLLFGYSSVVGPLMGAALGYVTLWIRRRLANPGLETVQGLVVPFAAFIAAEHFHASGVLAVVVAGFVVGSGTVDAGYQTRLQERYVWNSVDVLLEAFVFAYIGLHLRFVLEDLNEAHESLVEVAIASGIVLLVVLVIRPLSVFAMFSRGVLSRQVEKRLSVPVPERGGRGALGTRRRANAPAKWRSRIDNRALTWQENVVVSWTGMRGVVTLAAAAAIPATTAAGDPFPERATIQAIAFVVSVGTLLLQGWTLPMLIRRLDLSSDDDHTYTHVETAKAERVVHKAAEEVLDDFRANPPVGLDPRVLGEIRTTIARQSQDADEMPNPEAHTLRAETFAALYRAVLIAQRAALIGERDEGRIDDEAVRAMLERLDLQEAGVTARLESRL